MGLTDQRQGAKNTTDYQQNEKKSTDQRQRNTNRQPTWSDIVGMFVFSKNSILYLFLAQEMSRSFGGLYFTRGNHIKFQIQLIIEFPVIKLLYGPGILLFGEERGLISRTAAGNEAHETSCCSLFTARCLFMRSSHEWNYKSHCKFLLKKWTRKT